MSPYEALYGRPYRSPLCWANGEECVTLGSKMIQDTTENVRMIRERLPKVVQSYQNSYAVPKKPAIGFEIGDCVFLNVTPTQGIMRFEVKGKLAPRYIGLFEILERVKNVAYRLNLPPQLGHVHNVFYVSMLQKYT